MCVLHIVQLIRNNKYQWDRWGNWYATFFVIGMFAHWGWCVGCVNTHWATLPPSWRSSSEGNTLKTTCSVSCGTCISAREWRGLTQLQLPETWASDLDGDYSWMVKNLFSVSNLGLLELKKEQDEMCFYLPQLKSKYSGAPVCLAPFFCQPFFLWMAKPYIGCTPCTA